MIAKKSDCKKGGRASPAPPSKCTSDKVTSIALIDAFMIIYRSSHRKCSVRKGVLRNLTKFTGKYLCQSLYYNKDFNKETLEQVFSCKICEISKNTFFTEHFWAAASWYMEIFYVFVLKSKIFAGISFRKASGFCYKQNRKLLSRNCAIYCLENSNV